MGLLDEFNKAAQGAVPDLVTAAKNSVIAKLPGALAGDPVVVSPGGVVSAAGQPSPVKQTDAAFWTPGKVALAVLTVVAVGGVGYLIATR